MQNADAARRIGEPEIRDAPHRVPSAPEELLSVATRSFVAGCAAGVSGCIVGHPFDTVKLVQQTSAERSSLRGSTAELLRAGGHKAFWAGLGPALAVQVLTSGFLFGAQTSISAAVSNALAAFGSSAPTMTAAMPSEYRLQQAMAVSSVASATVSGFLTGGLLSPLVCPLEAIKCRSQVSWTSTAVRAGPAALTGLYSGWSATVLRCSLGNAASQRRLCTSGGKVPPLTFSARLARAGHRHSSEFMRSHKSWTCIRGLGAPLLALGFGSRACHSMYEWAGSHSSRAAL